MQKLGIPLSHAENYFRAFDINADGTYLLCFFTEEWLRGFSNSTQLVPTPLASPTSCWPRRTTRNLSSLYSFTAVRVGREALRGVSRAVCLAVGVLTETEFLLGLAAMDPDAPHSPPFLRVRLFYIFRLYDGNTGAS